MGWKYFLTRGWCLLLKKNLLEIRTEFFMHQRSSKHIFFAGKLAYAKKYQVAMPPYKQT
jgi:hypothetical protein